MWRITWRPFLEVISKVSVRDLCERKYSHKRLSEDFSGKFKEIRAKIFRTPKNLPAPTSMAEWTLMLLLQAVEIEFSGWTCCLLSFENLRRTLSAAKSQTQNLSNAFGFTALRFFYVSTTSFSFSASFTLSLAWSAFTIWNCNRCSGVTVYSKSWSHE